MANNYTPSYNQYLTQTAGYALPSSVRTYSVFDPASNSWRRMTNDGRSPIPTQGQTVYPAQGMGQGQPVEMHPGYLNPPAQASIQMPSRGSRTPSQPLQPRADISPRGFKASPETGIISLGTPTTVMNPVHEVRMPISQTTVSGVNTNPNTAPNPTDTAQNSPNILDIISSNPYVAYNPLVLGPRIMQKGIKETLPYAKSAVKNTIKAYNDLTNAGAQKLRDWHYGFLNWLDS